MLEAADETSVDPTRTMLVRVSRAEHHNSFYVAVYISAAERSKVSLCSIVIPPILTVSASQPKLTLLFILSHSFSTL